MVSPEITLNKIGCLLTYCSFYKEGNSAQASVFMKDVFGPTWKRVVSGIYLDSK